MKSKVVSRLQLCFTKWAWQNIKRWSGSFLQPATSIHANWLNPQKYLLFCEPLAQGEFESLRGQRIQRQDFIGEAIAQAAKVHWHLR